MDAADRSGVSHLFDVLEEHIRCFRELHRDTWATEYRAEGQCDVASQAFDDCLTGAGFALPHRIVEFWTDPIEGVQEGENHFANVIDLDGVSVVADWTARQFGLDACGRVPGYPAAAMLDDYLCDFGWESYETAAANWA